jgi:hypothetical protein
MALERIFGHTGFQCFETSIDGENTCFADGGLRVAVLPPEEGYGHRLLLNSKEAGEFMDSFRDRGVADRNDVRNLGGQSIYAYYIARTLIGFKRAEAVTEKDTGKKN